MEAEKSKTDCWQTRNPRAGSSRLNLNVKVSEEPMKDLKASRLRIPEEQMFQPKPEGWKRPMSHLSQAGLSTSVHRRVSLLFYLDLPLTDQLIRARYHIKEGNLPCLVYQFKR